MTMPCRLSLIDRRRSRLRHLRRRPPRQVRLQRRASVATYSPVHGQAATCHQIRCRGRVEQSRRIRYPERAERCRRPRSHVRVAISHQDQPPGQAAISRRVQRRGLVVICRYDRRLSLQVGLCRRAIVPPYRSQCRVRRGLGAFPRGRARYCVQPQQGRRRNAGSPSACLWWSQSSFSLSYLVLVPGAYLRLM